MASIPMFGNALHSRHIRSAYQRRRDDQNKEPQGVLQRSRSSQARLENLDHNKEHREHKHHHHHKQPHHEQHEHHVQPIRHQLFTNPHIPLQQYEHAKVHEKPIFALSLEAERMALSQLAMPSAPRRDRRALSAPELGDDSSQKPVESQAQPNGWKWDVGGTFRPFDISSSCIRKGIVDAIQTFANAPTA
ncbi:unnamed protein product [Bursaphelenchus okinawaensis]|uniref:Uncharacterized protein n=1 Tax=Bursaphelenchus okinawaensis TaxID=465554 RepID=A0A811LGZ1_9BILA|nr:unnamed protein product [Bursaphelenchus okinawaensis]CAG9125040.1 unnamed protein product [Bursaphelenchus okinawaensis]